MKLLLLCKIIYNLLHHEGFNSVCCDHEGFNSVCLDVCVLQTAYHYYRQRYGEAEKKTVVGYKYKDTLLKPSYNHCCK